MLPKYRFAEDVGRVAVLGAKHFRMVGAVIRPTTEQPGLLNSCAGQCAGRNQVPRGLHESSGYLSKSGFGSGARR